MTLKRKASFTTITSPRNQSKHYNPTSPMSGVLGDTITTDETPRHLHSRTRKRFKQDRPDEQSIYDKTLSWLFSAQKKLRHQEEPLASAPHAPSPENASPPSSFPDPNQQSLRKFFQPIQRSSSMPPQCMYNNVSTPVLASQAAAMRSVTSMDASMSDTNANATMVVPMNMDVDMDIDSGTDSSVSTPSCEKQWVGGLGWM